MKVENYNNSGDNKRENDVAIIGIGLRLPGYSNTPLELWDNLMNGFDGIVETSDRWSDSFSDLNDISSKYAGLIDFNEWMSFDPLFFGINPTDAKQIDPQQKLLLKCVWESFEDAGIDPLTIRGTDTPVYIGASSMDFSTTNFDFTESPINVFNSNLSGVSNRISYCFDLRGTSLTIDTACSSSSNAVHLGYESIVNGKSDYSIVGGCNFILNPYTSKSFTSVNVIGKSGKCNAFDESADGFVRAEGCVVLILKRLSLAILDNDNIYSIIKGTNSNIDGTLNKSNFFSPSKESQYNNILKAFEGTNGTLKYEDIDFFEAHGTGTQVGDPIEVEAVADVFKPFKSSDNPLLIGSIKSNIGHLEPASGVASLAKCCLMFKHRQFVKNINFENPNPNIKFKEWNIKVVTENTPFPTDRPVSMALNSFGITGSNTCILLTEYIKSIGNNEESVVNKKVEKYLIPISTNSKKSLDEYKSKLTDIAYNLTGIEFNDFIKYQINGKSTTLLQRSVLIANNWDDLNQDNLISFSTNNNVSGNIINKDNKQPQLVLVFCGQGSQYSKMGNQLYNNEPKFKEWMDKIDFIFLNKFGFSLLERLNRIVDDDKTSIHEPIISQTTLLMLQISLFELYKHWGITPSILVGHSFGEISSAYCSGMIDLETACHIGFIRSTLQNKTIGSGKMMAIGLNEKEFNEKFSMNYKNVEIACYNSPSSIVITGSEFDLNEISNYLKEMNIFNVMLGSISSFHSSKQECLKQDILNSFIDIKSNNSLITTFSTVTGYKLQSINSNYLYDNVRKPVLFQNAIGNIYKHIESNDLGKSVIFLELSPSPTLLHYLKEMVPVNSTYFEKDSITILSSLNKKKMMNDDLEIQSSISQLYCNGYNVNFKCQLQSLGKNKSSNYKESSYLLPRYQWDESIYWRQSGHIAMMNKQGPSLTILGNKDLNSPLISYTSFIDIKQEPFKYLNGHQSRDRIILPGCAYLYNILKVFPDLDLTICNLEFKTPIVLIGGIKQSISTNIYQSSKNEYRVLFHYKDQISGKWILSCSGRFSTSRHLNSEIAFKKVNIESLFKKCNFTNLKTKEFYNAMKIMSNLSFTGRFQSIKEAHYGYNCCLVKISLDGLSIHDNQTFLNTCILDGCFHPLCLLSDQPLSIVIEKMEQIKFYSDNIPKSPNDRKLHQFIYCYTELIGKVGNSIKGSIYAMLPDGTLIFHSPLVTFTSITPIKKQIISNPNNQLYKSCLQSKDSPFNTSYYSMVFHLLNSIPNHSKLTKDSISSYLFFSIKKKNPLITPLQISKESVDYLISTYFKINENGLYNLAVNVFEILKNNLIEYNQETINDLNSTDIETLNQIVKLIQNDITTIPSLQIEHIETIKEYKIIKEIIINSVTPLVNENLIFRILEIGCGVGELSEILLSSINELISNNPLSEIDIEYTFSDYIDSNAIFVKEKLSHLKLPKLSIIFNLIDLQNQELQLNPSYYDIILMGNTENLNIDDNFILNESLNIIYSILNPNGQFILIDSNYKNNDPENNEYNQYQQWLHYNYNDMNSNLTLSNNTIENWKQMFIGNCKFINFKSTFKKPYLIHVQKPTLSETVSKFRKSIATSGLHDQIIVFGNSVENEEDGEGSIIDLVLISSDVKRIYTIEEFDKHVKLFPLSNTSKIIFISTLSILTLENYKQVTMDYCRINQYILKNEIPECKHILVSKNVYFESTNSLAASVTGAFRYFCDFNTELNLYALDFGDDIFEKSINTLNLFQDLTDSTKHIQREYIIRGDKIYYDRISQVLNSKLKYKSNSYVNDMDNDLVVSLDQNLQFKLDARETKIQDHYIEVKVMAVGINFKDNLIYRRLVPNDVLNSKGDYNNPEFGLELSGIVTRVGKKVTKFKIGDCVMGTSFNCASTHVVNDQIRFVKKPNNLTFVEAASIPIVYITSYYSLFVSGNLDLPGKESVLIHGGSGGIGLSSIELLKSKGFKGWLFVTVGSLDKKDYLIDHYGDFITGIYSSKNTDYVYNIKKRISELLIGTRDDLVIGGIEFDLLKQGGVDLIVNTLSGEFMDSNFSLLNQGGRIVDLSITHINNSDTSDFNKFKYCIGYSTVEIFKCGFEKNSYILQIIVDMFESGQLKALPITEYSYLNVKEAIEYIATRKHIGKIVLNYQVDLIDDLIKNTILKSEFDKNYLINCPNYNIDNLNIGKTILLTGQTGLSLTILKWILNYSNNSKVKSIIVISKSPIKYELEYLISTNKMLKNGIEIYYKQIDVSNYNELKNGIKEIYNRNKEISNVETIFHNAFIANNCDPLEINIDHLNVSHCSKSEGAINLHLLSLENNWILKNIVLASSFTSSFGSEKQCGYISSNNFIDSFSRYIRSLGTPCISINWSVLEDTGYVSRNESASKLFETKGLIPVSKDTVLGTFDLFLQNPSTLSNSFIVGSFDYRLMEHTSKNNCLYYKLDYFFNQVESNNSLLNDEKEVPIKQIIVTKFSEILSTEDTKLNLDIKIIDYGVESSQIVEIKNWFDQTFITNIVSISKIQSSTINQIIQLVYLEKSIISNKSVKKKKPMLRNNNDSEHSVKIDWVSELKLDESISPKMITNYNNNIDKDKIVSNIFLTGSSGFLGIYLLFNLLKSNQISKVYCLSRKNSKEIGLNSLIDLLKTHQLFNSLSQIEILKIEIVLGDHSKDKFSIDKEEYDNLAEQVDLVISLAANTDPLLEYSKGRESVIGVDNCLKLACCKKLKKFLLISTILVYTDESPSYDEYKFHDIDTISFIESQNSYTSKYVQCKIIAEYHIREAASRGIPCMIIRPPFIFAAPVTGVGKDLDFIQTMIQSCYELNCYPLESNFQVYITNVTWFAINTSFIALSNRSCGSNVNVDGIDFWDSASNNSPFNNLTCFNLIGDGLLFSDILSSLAIDLGWEQVRFVKFIKKLRARDTDSCNRLSSFIKQQDFISNLVLPNSYPSNQQLKQSIINNNTFNGWELTKQVAIDHLNYTFKKKIL